MGILTKIFVVLVTIVSIVLVSLIIPFVDNTFYYQDRMKNAENENRTLISRADQASKDLNSSRDEIGKVRRELLDTKGQLQDQIAAHATKLAEREIKLVAVKNDLAREQTTKIAMSESVQKLTSINNMLTEEVRALREESMKHKLKNIELNTRITDLDFEINRYVRSIRAKGEEIVTWKAENERLKQLIEDLKNPENMGKGSLEVERNIIGMVTAVQQVGRNTLVEINVGSNDKVSDEMEFLVHQDGRYVGTLVITTVELNSSAGMMRTVVDDVKPNMEVMVNTLFR